MGRAIRRALAFIAAAPLLAFCAAPARSADTNAAPVVPTNVFSFFDEIRGGVFYGDLRTRANHSVSDAFETLTSPLPFYSGSNPFWSAFLNPRINVGAMVSLQGATSYAYSGLTWRVPVYDRLFVEGEFGDAINDSSRKLGTSRTDLGCPVTFRESGGLGVQLTPAIDLVVSAEHISHANLCGRLNPGLTNFGLRLGYRF
jgi:lipid A 3-O-deacylase